MLKARVRLVDAATAPGRSAMTRSASAADNVMELTTLKLAAAAVSDFKCATDLVQPAMHVTQPLFPPTSSAAVATVVHK